MSYPAPVSVVATPLNSGVKLDITNPAIPSGYTILYYNLYEPTIFPSGQNIGSDSPAFYVDPGTVTNGQSYTFTVSIVWDDGISQVESSETATTPTNITPAAGTPPDAVPISILPKANPTNLEIWWEPVPNSGSTPLYLYYIDMASDPDFINTVQATSVGASTNYFNINEASIFTPVPSNLNYIRMQAWNENFDKGPFTNYLFTQIGYFPSEPQTPSATRLSATSANVTWTAPASDGGAALQYYIVNALPSNAGVSTVQSFYATETSVTIQGLSSGEDYNFSIEAVNPPGYSPAAFTNYIGP
jgi:hypothetical protein